MSAIIKKKLIYRASHRGSREGDLILAQYVQTVIGYLLEDELQMLESFLDEADLDILEWLTEKTQAPEKYQATIDSYKKYKSGLYSLI